MCRITGVSTGGGWVKGKGVARPTRPIRFGTYNIRNGRNRGLESALHRISQANMDLGIFQETKITKRIYTRASSGYKVVDTEAPITHSGGVSILYWTAKHFYLEEFQAYGENVVSSQLASGYRRWYIVGCYLAPDDASTVEDVVADIGKQHQGGALLMLVDFNTSLVAPEGQERDEGIPEALAEEYLEDMSRHFFPHHKPRLKDGHIWTMRRGGWDVRSLTDYILNT